MSVSDIKSAAKKIIEYRGSKVVKAYLLENLESVPGASEINRTCGGPIGISDERWPMYEGKKMAHAITLDLKSVPSLKPNFPAGARAVAVFVSNLLVNEAYEPGNKETAVVLLTDKDLEIGVREWQDPEDEEFESVTYKTHEVELPEEVFGGDLYELDEDDPLYLLSEDLCEYSMAGGAAIWLQGDEHDGEIIMQFDNCLVDMNLGDGGIMYVFKDTAFWQCH